MLIELDTRLIGPKKEDQKLGNATSLIVSNGFENVGVEFTLRLPHRYARRTGTGTGTSENN